MRATVRYDVAAKREERADRAIALLHDKALWFVVGAVVFLVLSVACAHARGYVAIGGEGAFLALPLWAEVIADVWEQVSGR